MTASKGSLLQVFRMEVRGDRHSQNRGAYQASHPFIRFNFWVSLCSEALASALPLSPSGNLSPPDVLRFPSLLTENGILTSAASGPGQEDQHQYFCSCPLLWSLPLLQHWYLSLSHKYLQHSGKHPHSGIPLWGFQWQLLLQAREAQDISAHNHAAIWTAVACRGICSSNGILRCRWLKQRYIYACCVPWDKDCGNSHHCWQREISGFHLKSGSTHTGNAVPTPAVHHWEKLAGNTLCCSQKCFNVTIIYNFIYTPLSVIERGKSSSPPEDSAAWEEWTDLFSSTCL